MNISILAVFYCDCQWIYIRFLPTNSVGRFEIRFWVLGRLTRFCNPVLFVPVNQFHSSLPSTNIMLSLIHYISQNKS